jgi:hypothetical protein
VLALSADADLPLIKGSAKRLISTKIEKPVKRLKFFNLCKY